MTSNTDEAPAALEDDGGKRSRGVKLFLRDILLILLAALLISFLIKTFLIRSFFIPSESMEDTLMVNDRIIVNQLTPELMPLEHGDVVVFKDPGGWLENQPDAPEVSPFQHTVDTVLTFIGLSAADSNDHLVKRVIGMPGDHVVCCNALGQLTVNGIPLNEPYIVKDAGETNATPEVFDVTVPKDSLWVMGDNRYHSADSAYNHLEKPGHEFVPYSDVVGRAIVISWPISRWSWLDNYPTVFSGVEDEKK